jgi:pimeloyl-ACP methyl ester carboxylesterase
MQTPKGRALINGAELAYETRGQGQPLVLIHAGVADSRMWDAQVAEFANNFRVIRYDLRGFGQSPMPSGCFAHYADLRGLLDFLQVEQAAVVGLSYGGQVALDFTLAYPERVTALIMGAPATVGGSEPSAVIQQFGEEEEALLEAGDLASATALNVRMWVDGSQRTSDQVDAEIRDLVYAMQLHAFALPVPEGVTMDRLTPPAIERLGEVQVPTLILAGDLDVPGVAELADQLASEIPGAQKVILTGVAHMINLERPAEFNRLVTEFLDISSRMEHRK